MNLYGKTGRDFYRLERRAMAQGRAVKAAIGIGAIITLGAGFVFTTHLYGMILYGLGVSLAAMGVR